MTNDELPNDESNPDAAIHGNGPFDTRAWDFIRHSDFIIRHCSGSERIQHALKDHQAFIRMRRRDIERREPADNVRAGRRDHHAGIEELLREEDGGGFVTGLGFEGLGVQFPADEESWRTK